MWRPTFHKLPKTSALKFLSFTAEAGVWVRTCCLKVSLHRKLPEALGGERTNTHVQNKNQSSCLLLVSGAVISSASEGESVEIQSKISPSTESLESVMRVGTGAADQRLDLERVNLEERWKNKNFSLKMYSLNENSRIYG